MDFVKPVCKTNKNTYRAEMLKENFAERYKNVIESCLP